MKKIIVPIDFSELSQTGLELAILLSKPLEAQIEMVHVIKIEKNTFPSMEKLALTRIQQLFENLLGKYKKLYPEIEITYIIKEGKIHEEVVNQAKAYRDSLIVTSTHGFSGWEELFIGNNAYKIVASSLYPVLTIRGNKIPDQIKKIVLPLDNTPETREKVPYTAKLAGTLKAEVDVATVSLSHLPDLQDKLNDYGIQVCKYFTQHNIKNSLVQLTGNNLTDITIDYALSERADLVSIMTEQEKSISNILLGSFTHQMINKSPVPVLLFPTKQIGIITESFKTEGINY